MALYEVTLFQTYAGQEIVNRWNYVSSGTPASVSGSFGLAFALGGIFESAGIGTFYDSNKLLCKIAAMQAPTVVFDGLAIRSIYDPVDFYEAPFVQPLVGAASASDGMSPAMAVGFRTTRVRGDIRRGTKRFTGMTEGNVQTLGVLLPAFVTLANAVSVEMSEVQTYDDEGSTLSYVPTIVSKECYDPGTDAPCISSTTRKAYRYYDTLLEQQEHWAQGFAWDVYPQVRTQVSRQYGRGR